MTAASAPHDEIIGSRQGWQFVPALVVAWLGLNVAVNGFLGAAIPKAVYLLGRADKDAHLALVTSIGGVVALIATPVCGRLSDRTRARWGMRKPWMLGGSVVIVLGAVVLAYSHSLVSLIVGWSLTQLGISAVAMGQHTLLADQVPARTRARVAAATGVASSLGAVLGAMIVGALPQDRRTCGSSCSPSSQLSCPHSCAWRTRTRASLVRHHLFVVVTSSIRSGSTRSPIGISPGHGCAASSSPWRS